MDKQKMEDRERALWTALKNKDKEKFRAMMDETTVMVCGSYRCSGEEYVQFIPNFDCKSFTFSNFEIIAQNEQFEQVHYIVKTEVELAQNSDLAGLFHVTSTWQKKNDEWVLAYNMDSRIFE